MHPVHTPLALASQDAVDWLRSLPDACADLIVTDPSYESLEKHRAVGTTTRLKHSKASSNDWFRVFPNSRFGELLCELHRVLKRNRHCYVFSDQETMFVIKPIAEEVGFRFWKPIVWDKVTMGMGYHYRARYEFVLFSRRASADSISPLPISCRNGERDAVEVSHGHCEVEESAHPVAQGKRPVCNPIWRTFHLERTMHHCVTLH